jgi:hypothetical protein
MNTDDLAQVSIAGRTQRALRAVRKIARLCGGHFDLKIADVSLRPERVGRRCVEAPGLIRVPLPPSYRAAGVLLDFIGALTGLRLAAE